MPRQERLCSCFSSFAKESIPDLISLTIEEELRYTFRRACQRMHSNSYWRDILPPLMSPSECFLYMWPCATKLIVFMFVSCWKPISFLCYRRLAKGLLLFQIAASIANNPVETRGILTRKQDEVVRLIRDAIRSKSEEIGLSDLVVSRVCSFVLPEDFAPDRRGANVVGMTAMK